MTSTPISITTSGSGALALVRSIGVIKQAINWLAFPFAFNDSHWTKTGSNVTADAAVAPDGTTTADLLYENSGNSQHGMGQSNSKVDPLFGPVYASIFIKRASGTRFPQLQIQSTGNVEQWTFDLEGGVSHNTFGGNFGFTPFLRTLVNGWYWIGLTKGAPSGVANLGFNLYYATNYAGNNSYTGDGASGFYLWDTELRTDLMEPYGAFVALRSTGLFKALTASAVLVFQRAQGIIKTLASTGAASRVVAAGMVRSFTAGKTFAFVRTISKIFASLNLLFAPYAFDDAHWVRSGTNVTPDATTAPDGTTTADLLYEDASNGQHLISETLGFTSILPLNTHVYVKRAAGTRFPQIQVQVDGNPEQWTFDLENGAFQLTYGSSYGTSPFIVALANGWYRIGFVNTLGFPAGTTISWNLVYATNYAGNNTYIGDGTSGFYLWEAELKIDLMGSYGVPSLIRSIARQYLFGALAAASRILSTRLNRLQTATGALTRTVGPVLIKTFVAMGVPSLIRSIAPRYLFAGSGANVSPPPHRTLWLWFFPVGNWAFQKSVGLVRSAVSSGVLGFIRSIPRGYGFSSTGTLSSSRSMPRVLAVAASGVLSFLRTAAHVCLVRVWGFGWPTFARGAARFRTLATTSPGTLLFGRVASRLFAMTSMAALILRLSIGRTLALVSTAAITFARVLASRRTLAFLSSGTLTPAKAFAKTVTMTAGHVLSFLRIPTRLMMVHGMGTLTFARSFYIGRVFFFSTRATLTFFGRFMSWVRPSSRVLKVQPENRILPVDREG